jgi:type II secretion system protein N
MKLRRLLLIGAGLLGALFLFVVLTLSFIPDRELQALAVRALFREGYTLRATHFGKAFPLGVKAATMEIANDSGVLLIARDTVIRLSLLSLLTGKLAFTGQAGIGSGHVAFDWTPQNGAAAIELTGVHLEDLPFIQNLTGARVKGVARLHGHFKGKGKAGSGELQLENVAEVKIGGMPLPDADYSTIQGMVRAGGGVLTLGSFTMEGEGLYVRLKGDLPLTTPPGAAPLNITLEMMPKPEFLEKQKFVFLLLTKYLATPGRYEIPIRGTLANPLIQ